MSWTVLPRPLPVSGKSSAMRGGLAMAKPAGGFASGAFSVNLITVRPELALETVSASRLLAACARTSPAPSATSPARSAITLARACQRKRLEPVHGKGLIFVAPVFDRLRPQAA